MKKVLIGAVALGGFLATTFAGASAQQQFVSIGTGGVTGVYYPTGGAICRLVNKKRKEHGIRCSAESTGGSIFNINTIRAGELEFGVAQSDWQYHAYNGTSKFAEKGKFEKLRAVFSVHAEPVTIIARADANINNVTDLKGKRVNIGNPGSGTRGTWEVMEKALGWERSDLALAAGMKSSETSAAVCDGKLDAYFWLVGHPSALTQESIASCASNLVNAQTPEIDKLIADTPYYRTAVIPAGMYNNKEDIKTFGVGATFVTSADVPEKVVYEVVKAVFENIDQFKKLHPAFKNLNPAEMINAGIEGHFDRELSGKNGYLEQRGLREMRAGKGTTDIPPVDGLDVALTLDLALQDAAVDCLRNPRRDPTGEKMDEDWLRQPTGAIVFARVNGDVLAAASFPDLDRGSGKGRDLALERTLRKPGFLPAGSVFKPFVAAWALDHLGGYDPHEEVGCFLLEDGSGSGWGSMRCWRQYGHAEVALHQAIAQSCNGYFAWLGSQLTTEDFRWLTREFGFGRPTGVRTFPDRGGLREDTNQALLRDELKGREFLMAGNGLGVIEVTPMQVARAYAGLATGRLPEMRLVDRVGGEPLPRTSRPLDLSQAALARVRAGLADVTNGERGSGRNALSTAALGFRISAKTGSADYTAKSVDGRGFDKIVLKHTWLAGWFPPEDPEFVLVVFVHRTVATSGHSSIWIAQDFLQREAVQALFTEDGEGR